MRRVYKYTLDFIDDYAEDILDGAVKCELKIPIGSRFLRIDLQNGVKTLWVEVNPKSKERTETFYLYSTGWDIKRTDINWRATIMDGIFVWHIYEKLRIVGQDRRKPLNG